MKAKLLEYKDKLINDISIFTVIFDLRLKLNYFDDYEKNYYDLKKEKFIKQFNENYNNKNFAENINETNISLSLHSKIFKKKQNRNCKRD